MPQSHTTKEHQNSEQVDKAVKIEVVQMDWERQGEPYVGQRAYGSLGHLGRDATYRWACDRGVDLTMEAVMQVIHECETSATIKQSSRVKSP